MTEPRFHLAEAIVTVYALLMSVLVVVFHAQIESWWLYLVYHAGVLAMMGLIATAYSRFGGRFWRAVRYWYPAIVLLASFRELNFLIPPIHPFEPDYVWDHRLGGIDTALLGTDLETLLAAVTWEPLSDLLAICYLMYFPMPVILCLALYRSDRLRDLRYAVGGLFLAWYLSYVGYILIPAVGPHRMMDVRPPALDGLFIGAIAHGFVRGGEWDMPNAFPSGHALITMMTLAYAFVLHRKVFYVLLPFGCGLILATVYLRYHYLTDVLASAALFPLTLWAAKKLFTAWEKEKVPDMLPTGF